MTKSVILLTGATGFVGGHLARRLAVEDRALHALIRPGSDASQLHALGVRCHHHHHGDGLIDVVRGIGPDLVFHLGALYVAEHRPEDVARLVEANILFGAQLLEAMAACGTVRLVTAGTAWQNMAPDDASPVNLYAASKSAFDCLIDYYSAARDLRAVTLRLYDSFGQGDKRPKLLTLLRQAAIDGRRLEMSDGEQILCPAHIDDIVEALLASAAATARWSEAAHRSYAAPGPQHLTLRDLVALFEQICGRKLNIVWGAKPYRAREVLRPWLGEPPPGWQARISLADGLRDLLRENSCSS